MTHAQALERMAGRYRGRRRASALALAVGAALLAAGLTGALGGSATLAAAAAMLAFAALLVWAWDRARRHPVAAVHVARHLDRTILELEESTELLLAEAGSLPLVAALERRRVAAAFDRVGALDAPPDRASRRAMAGGVIAALAGALLLLIPRGVPARDTPVRAVAPPAAGALIGGVDVRVTPPPYTGLPARDQRAWDIAAPEGADVVWRIGVEADSAWLVTTTDDTVRLEASGPIRSGTIHARTSVLYQVIAERGGRHVVSDFHRLAVEPDAAPTIAITAPRGRTELAPGSALRVSVEAVAGDDYGLGAARLVATLTSGEGEAVRFRERTFALVAGGPHSTLPHGVTLRATLDLAALGLKPGDELYFHAEVSDRRTPQPNVARSETVFLSILDTARIATATIAGIALRLQPEYFRSERQIIIDTEKLLADRPRITLESFRNRSNDIGLDQGLLRARYGQFVGDETETGDDATTAHQHDTPENSTLLAATVKAKLKGALEQMWAAELRLRTYRPAEALPYEYRALDLLKQAQQSARVYVQKVGFEPPPLDPLRTRLTGKLDAIASRADRDTLAVLPALPAVRVAVGVLGTLAPGVAIGAADVRALEQAEVELAPLAAVQPDQLVTMRALRAVADSARAGATCVRCASEALRGLLRALPGAAPLPSRVLPGVAPLTQRYFEHLESR